MKMVWLLLFVFLLFYTTLASKAAEKPPRRKTWLTLRGTEPLVVARGGFSGLFPESSRDAYALAQQVSLPDSIMYCDLQLTKDGEGFCQSQINLQNSTNISEIFPKGQKDYNINGKDIRGWFGLDFGALDLLGNVTLHQNIFSRTSAFDGASMTTPLDIVSSDKPSRIWINVEYNMFYNQNNLQPAKFIESGMEKFAPHYISSPEIGFVKSIGARIHKDRTKLIFKFLEADEVEPTTKQKYGSLLKNLSTIKLFASGILVPREYIWPVDKDRYLQPATALVTDAHKEGLEVYASGFANDNLLSYNYSYDPTREYLQFIGNSQFSVDGVLTDFPSTASESIACLVQNKNSSRILKTLIISNDGASGDYPGSTDLAYQKAIDDGVDVIDCSVQMSKDGVSFCLDSADLTGTTTAATTFMERSTMIPMCFFWYDFILLLQLRFQVLLIKIWLEIQRVLNVKRNVGGVSEQIAQEVKKYADAISVRRSSVVQSYPQLYLTSNLTNIIPYMHAANVSVYVGVLRNEFSNFLFDFFSDPYVELATYVAAGANGVITDFPATANAYMSKSCNLMNLFMKYYQGQCIDHISHFVFTKRSICSPFPSATEGKYPGGEQLYQIGLRKSF